MPFWLAAYYIFTRTSNFSSLSSSSCIAQQRILATRTPKPDWCESELSEMTAASCNASLDRTQQQCRYKIFNFDGANSNTANMTNDPQLEALHKTRSSKYLRLHPIGHQYLHIMVDGHQITAEYTVRICRELQGQCIAAPSGTPPWLMTAFVCTVCRF
jgi:hypothetical protein